MSLLLSMLPDLFYTQDPNPELLMAGLILLLQSDTLDNSPTDVFINDNLALRLSSQVNLDWFGLITKTHCSIFINCCHISNFPLRPHKTVAMV